MRGADFMRQRGINLGALAGGILAACLVLMGCGAGDAGKAVGAATDAQAGSRPSPPTASPVAERISSDAPGPATTSIPLAAAPKAPDTSATTAPSATEGSLYVCVTGTTTAQQRTPIELSPSVDKLCRKAPEMGPCQYEREVCRRKGGTVYTAAGVEITKQIEAEYDRRVTRIRMKSN
jgi:hypothetical protein